MGKALSALKERFGKTAPDPDPQQAAHEQEAEQKARVSTLRKQVREHFQGQKFLVIGGEGAGKSSLINTINHVVRLEKPDVIHQELAEAAKVAAATKTILFQKFDSIPKHGAMFEGVDVPYDKKPVFFDVCGMSENERANVGDIIPLLATGKIKEGTDLRPLLDIKYDLKELSASTTDEMKCWSIIFVTSAVHDPLPKLAACVGEAWEKLELEGWGIRIFCVLTYADKLKDDDDDKKRLKKCRRRMGECLRIPDRRIWEVSNYIDDDLLPDHRTKPNLDKDERILYAMLGMLQGAHIPRSVEAAST